MFKKKTNWLVLLVAMYVAGFFVAPIAAILSTKTQVTVIIRMSHALIDVLYWSWVKNLDTKNKVRIVWHANGPYWCQQFESCTVVKESI